MLISAPGSCHRAPKTLGISWVVGVSLVFHNRPHLMASECKQMRRLRAGPLDSLRIGLVTSKTK